MGGSREGRQQETAAAETVGSKQGSQGWPWQSGADEAKHPGTEQSLTHGRAKEPHLATLTTLFSPSLLENISKC